MLTFIGAVLIMTIPFWGSAIMKALIPEEKHKPVIYPEITDRKAEIERKIAHHEQRLALDLRMLAEDGKPQDHNVQFHRRQIYNLKTILEHMD